MVGPPHFPILQKWIFLGQFNILLEPNTHQSMSNHSIQRKFIIYFGTKRTLISGENRGRILGSETSFAFSLASGCAHGRAGKFSWSNIVALK
jgi:hypothetical protein